MGNPLVSIIIPTTDRELSLAQKCANSVLNSTYKQTEIILVNEHKERSEQRSIGIFRAKGSYLMFLDSDQYISPELIEECVELMTQYDALYIPEEIITEGRFAKLRNWERGFYTGTAIDVPRFLKAENCPFFSPLMHGPEDSDWGRRIIGKRGITKNVLYHNEQYADIYTYFKKKSYYSRSMGKYKERNSDDKILDWRWRLFGVFFERDSWKRVLRRLDLMFLIWCILFIRGVIYLWCKKKS